MKVKLIPKSDADAVHKFSEFILEFNDTAEFITYIRTNNFRVERRGLEDFIPNKYVPLLENNLEYFDTAFRNNLEQEQFPNLSSIAYNHLPLVNKKKEIRLIPLHKFIQMLNQRGRAVDKNHLLEEMKLEGHYFLYWNKATMYFDFDAIELDVEEITIYRKYVGYRKRTKWGEPHILVKGLDGKKKDINQEATSYFKGMGLNVVYTAPVTIKNTKMITNPFLDDNRVAKIFRKEDRDKILKFEKREKISECYFTGFPDLFVWDRQGRYFF